MFTRFESLDSIVVVVRTVPFATLFTVIYSHVSNLFNRVNFLVICDDSYYVIVVLSTHYLFKEDVENFRAVIRFKDFSARCVIGQFQSRGSNMRI